MKISAFARAYDLNKTTTRYYTQLKLLLPELQGTYPSYGEKCHKDMTEILALKAMGFSMEKIQRIIVMKRFYVHPSPEENQEVKAVYQAHLLNLKEELGLKLQQIEAVNEAVGRLDDHPGQRQLQVPLRAVDYFLCPMCGEGFVLSQATITPDGFSQAKMSCNCGKNYIIDQGMLMPSGAGVARDLPRKSSEFLTMLDSNHTHVMHQVGQQMKEYISTWDEKEPIIFCNADEDILIHDLEGFARKGALYFLCSYDYDGLKALKDKLECTAIACDSVFVYFNDKLPLKGKMPYLIDNAGNMYDYVMDKPLGFGIRAFSHMVHENSQWLRVHYHGQGKSAMGHHIKEEAYMSIYSDMGLVKSKDMLDYCKDMIPGVACIEDLRVVVKSMTFANDKKAERP